MNNVTCSIVLYNNASSEILEALNGIMKSSMVGLVYLVDNSPNDDLRTVATNDKIIYLYNPANPGFGAAHNLAINLALQAGSLYHFVVNPDTYFYGNVIEQMVNYIHKNPQTGMLMPEILYPDGRVQYLPKLLPNPLSIVMRKLKFLKGLNDKFNNRYELRFVDRKTIYRAPVISGCFTLLNLKAVEEVGGYDDAYFMYFEDWDLSRRMAEKYDTVYFPNVFVYHHYASGANKSVDLFKIYINSALHYFSKWGWIFDKLRKELNSKALLQFK
jgi:GT2 family glycosyltransferase